jgi:hypothetical protein
MVSLADSAGRPSGFPARTATPVACLQGELVDATVMKVLLWRPIGRARNCARQNLLPFPTDSRKASRMHNECAISRTAARNFANDRQGYRGVNAAAALAGRCPEQPRWFEISIRVWCGPLRSTNANSAAPRDGCSTPAQARRGSSQAAVGLWRANADAGDQAIATGAPCPRTLIPCYAWVIE